MRGVMVALRCRVDLINMSYGEASAQCDVGRFPEAVRELINKYGVLFVCSAGNSGPALTTAGSPGATTSDIIGVGAYVSPAMMLANYSLRRSLQATQYTWSSRGPSADGALGVCISAPGGAITSVPTWTLQGVALMHGTSMSSPSATSALSLLLSACKREGVRYSPHRIRKAIENTAAEVPGLDALTTGCGLLQVESAYAWMKQFAHFDDLDVAFRVTVGGSQRGVYLREREEVSHSQELTVTVEPSFFEPEDDAVTPPFPRGPPHPADKDSAAASSDSSIDAVSPSSSSPSHARNLSKVAFQLRVALINPAPAYIDCSSHLMLMHGGRSFAITVHPQRLPPGLHHTAILGVDSTAPERGPLFRIPITVTAPERPQSEAVTVEAMAPLSLGGVAAPESAEDGEEVNREIFPSFPTPLVSFAASSPTHRAPSPAPSPLSGLDYQFPSLPFTPGTIHRRFVLIPQGATWVDFRVRGHAIDTSRQFMFHAVFLLPDMPFRDHELLKLFSLQDEEELRWSMDVVGGRTLELCLAQYWNADGTCSADIDASFHSIQCDRGESSITLDGAQSLHRLDLATPLRMEAVNPVVSLKSVQQPMRPTSSHLGALTALDVLPGSRQVYELVLGYSWESKEETAKVTCVFPLLQGVLYESCYESQLFMIFDAAKRLVGSGDAWPKEVSVKKGRYTIRIQVRHDDVAMLERVREQVLLVEVQLPKPLDLSVYPTRNAALQAGTKFGDRRVMKAGQRRPMWLLGPDMKPLPSWVKAGDVLVGSLAVSKGNGTAAKAGSIALKVSVPPLLVPEKKEGKGERQQKAKAAVKADAEERALKAEEKPLEEAKEAEVRPEDVEAKKKLEEVRPAVTEEEKERKQHTVGSDVDISLGAFEKKEGGEEEEGKGEREGEGKETGAALGKEIDEEVRDLQIDYVSGLKGAKKQAAFQRLFPQLSAQYPQHLPLLVPQSGDGLRGLQRSPRGLALVSSDASFLLSARLLAGGVGRLRRGGGGVEPDGARRALWPPAGQGVARAEQGAQGLRQAAGLARHRAGHQAAGAQGGGWGAERGRQSLSLRARVRGGHRLGGPHCEGAAQEVLRADRRVESRAGQAGGGSEAAQRQHRRGGGGRGHGGRVRGAAGDAAGAGQRPSSGAALGALRGGLAGHSLPTRLHALLKASGSVCDGAALADRSHGCSAGTGRCASGSSASALSLLLPLSSAVLAAGCGGAVGVGGFCGRRALLERLPLLQRHRLRLAPLVHPY